jgi:hypothetical protein
MKDKLIRKVKKKFHKALLRFEEEFPKIEIINFSYSSIERSVFLIKDIVSKLNSLYRFEEYFFEYYFSIKPLSEDFPVSLVLRFIVKGEKFRFYSPAVTHLYRDLKFSGPYALFLGLYFRDLEVEWEEEENSREIIIDALKEIANEKGLNFHLHFSSPNIDDFVEDTFLFEIPVKADIVEYIV